MVQFYAPPGLQTALGEEIHQAQILMARMALADRYVEWQRILQNKNVQSELTDGKWYNKLVLEAAEATRVGDLKTYYKQNVAQASTLEGRNTSHAERYCPHRRIS
jgi:hypothetical protein